MPSQQQRDEGDTGAARRGPNPLVCEMFQGINTKTTRPGVADQQMYWCDGFMPLAPRKLRTLWGLGPALAGSSSSGIVCFFFFNLGSTQYVIGFLSDGSAVIINLGVAGNAVVSSVQIMPPGTILNPAITQLGVTQYDGQYLIIVANQANGYWLWDGSILYAAGSIGPQPLLTNVGAGYFAPPTVLASGGHGTGAQFTANIANGVVTGVNVVNPGAGYLANDVVTLTFTGGNAAGSGASLTAVLSNHAGGSGGSITLKTSLQGLFYQVTGIVINNPGSGYGPNTVCNVSGGAVFGGNNAVVSLQISLSGTIASATVVNPGSYNSSTAPTATVSDPGYFTVTSVTIISGGTGYSPFTTITASGGGSPQSQAVLSLQIVGGVIVGVSVTSGGVYGSNTPPTLAANDTKTDAAATIVLMPFGVSGNAVQTYSGHVWVINGKLVQFSAPGSVNNFATAAGGGSFVSSDSFLKIGYTAAVQSNGFLFLIGDCSMNYISGVQTNTPAMGNPTTTFTNNNSDPETGTPYPATVTTFGEDIFIANATGVFVSSGGTFVKKSDDLDGVYNTQPNFAGQQLSSAKATVFAQKVWIVLVPIIDPITGLPDNELFMFNGKFWWATGQDVPLTYITTQEIGSKFMAWGTDGRNIYQLFAQPSANFQKFMQTRLWDAPAGYDHTKSSGRLFALAQFLGSQNLSYQIGIDNELPSSQQAGPYVGLPVPFSWTNGSNAFPWTNGGPAFPWYLTGINAVAVLPPAAIGQFGVLTGMTTTTMCDDMILISEMMQDEVVQYRG